MENKEINTQKNNPLHGIKLADMLTELVEKLGFEKLNKLTGARCFINNPTINSSLKFLRKTPWAREAIEKIYLEKVVAINRNKN